MSLFDEPPLHDFPDRAIRRLLEDPRNLRDLIAAVPPDLVDRFDFAQLEPVARTFLLDDWRERESDLLFRLPFYQADLPSALVCLLIEHQTEPHAWMPLRILVYAALYWEREWRAWETQQPRSERFRLSPIVPIIFHTGSSPWQKNRVLADLIGGPEELRPFAPRWEPLFWNLAEQELPALLAGAGEWLASLAVVRAEEEREAAAFREVFAAVLQRLERLSETEPVRWHDLLWFVLSWALRRRPGRERDELLTAAEESQLEATHREEVRRMSETIEQTWEQELLARGEARGEARGQLRAHRENLRLLLEERFGPLPEAVVQRIEAAQEPERLRNALRQAIHIQSADELNL